MRYLARMGFPPPPEIASRPTMRLRHAGSDLPPTYWHNESDICLRTPRASLVLDLFWMDPSRLMTFLSKGPLPPPSLLMFLLRLLLLLCSSAAHVKTRGRGGTAPHRIGQSGGLEAWVGPVCRDTLSSACESVALLCSIDARLYIESGSETARRCRLLKRVGRHLPCPALPCHCCKQATLATCSFAFSLSITLPLPLLLYGHRIGRRTVSWPSPVALLIIIRESMLVLLSLRGPVFCPFTLCVCYYFISSALQASPMGPLETLV